MSQQNGRCQHSAPAERKSNRMETGQEIKKTVTDEIMDQLEEELKGLRHMLIEARTKNNVDDAIKLTAAIARIVRESCFAKHQLEQMSEAAISRMAMAAKHQLGLTARQAERKKEQQMPQPQSDATADIASILGPQAMQALAAIATVSQKLGGAPPSIKAVPQAESSEEE